MSNKKDVIKGSYQYDSSYPLERGNRKNLKKANPGVFVRVNNGRLNPSLETPPVIFFVGRALCILNFSVLLLIASL